MPRSCIEIDVDCSECADLSATPCQSLINLPVGLTPTNQYYLWVRDKFQNLYYDLVTVNADGSVDIDVSNFPDGMFEIANNILDIFLTDDILGLNLVTVFISAVEYNCIMLRVEEVEMETDEEILLLTDEGDQIILDT